VEILLTCLDFLNKYSAAITALATVVITGLTYFLAMDSRKARKAGSDPEVVAYLAPHPDGTGGVNFILSNVGQGPAFSVSFRFECDEDDFDDHEVMLRNEPKRTALNVLPSGEKIGSLFGVGFVLFGKTKDKSGVPLKPFQVKVSYSDIREMKKSASYSIDISQFMGLAGLLGRPADREISDSLKKIERHVADWSRNTTYSANLLDTTELKHDVRRKAKSRTGDETGEV